MRQAVQWSELCPKRPAFAFKQLSDWYVPNDALRRQFFPLQKTLQSSEPMVIRNFNQVVRIKNLAFNYEPNDYLLGWHNLVPPPGLQFSAGKVSPDFSIVQKDNVAGRLLAAFDAFSRAV